MISEPDSWVGGSDFYPNLTAMNAIFYIVSGNNLSLVCVYIEINILVYLEIYTYVYHLFDYQKRARRPCVKSVRTLLNIIIIK